MAFKKVPINSECEKSPNGRHDWHTGRDNSGKIHTWCHHCNCIPK